MDLRSIVNEDGDANAKRNAPPNGPLPPQQHPRPPSQHQMQPQMMQSPVQYQQRGYPGQHGAPPPPSPGNRAMSHEYHFSPRQQAEHYHQNSYPPPASPYQGPGPAPLRTAAPPLQPPGAYRDPRSPSMGSMSSVPAQSPYRTPTTGPGGGQAFPFPPAHAPPEMPSPAQRPQPPPPQYHQHPVRQDSHPHGVSPHAPGPHPQQMQHPSQHQAIPHPQTPSGAPPGSGYAYTQARSQSIQSTPTPTSAHSQPPYSSHFAQGSPIVPNRPLLGHEQRHSSQPPTPAGHPLSAGPGRPAGSFVQPPSPHQQRTSSTPSAYAAQTLSSPASSHPALVQPQVHRQSISITHHTPPSDPRRRSMSHRESMSISPKTRVSSITTNPDRPLASRENDPKFAAHVQNMAVDTEAATTPAKRKLADRDLSPSELERKGTRPPPAEVNGAHAPSTQEVRPEASQRKKRNRYPEPPIWAQSARTLGKALPSHDNFVLQKRVASHINGKKEGPPRPDPVSRHSSLEASKPRPPNKPQDTLPAEPTPAAVLGPWEPSLTGIKPSEEMSKNVADFLFIHVVNNEDSRTIAANPDIQFEIEAKLGRLIDRDTNHRIQPRLATESILDDSWRVAFKSTMTEAHHKAYNDFLNEVVIKADPRNPSGGGRVQVHYKHRREIDRFFELPPSLQERLPACVRTRCRKGVRARVTYDQKTGDVLAKIVKARVADIDLHMPQSPMDCRISVNLEMKWDGPVEELEEAAASYAEKAPDRRKDRLSYTQGHYQVDLTQVTQTGKAQRPEKEHELEIELNPDILIEQGQRAMSGAPHRYQELVEGLLDNVRLLGRKAVEFGGE